MSKFFEERVLHAVTYNHFFKLGSELFNNTRPTCSAEDLVLIEERTRGLNLLMKAELMAVDSCEFEQLAVLFCNDYTTYNERPMGKCSLESKFIKRERGVLLYSKAEEAAKYSEELLNLSKNIGNRSRFPADIEWEKRLYEKALTLPKKTIENKISQIEPSPELNKKSKKFDNLKVQAEFFFEEDDSKRKRETFKDVEKYAQCSMHFIELAKLALESTSTLWKRENILSKELCVKAESMANSFNDYYSLANFVYRYFEDVEWFIKLLAKAEELALDFEDFLNLAATLLIGDKTKDKRWGIKIFEKAEKEAISFDEIIMLYRLITENLQDGKWSFLLLKEAASKAESFDELLELGSKVSRYDKEWGKNIFIKAETKVEGFEAYLILAKSVEESLEKDELTRMYYEKAEKHTFSIEEHITLAREIGGSEYGFRDIKWARKVGNRASKIGNSYKDFTLLESISYLYPKKRIKSTKFEYYIAKGYYSIFRPREKASKIKNLKKAETLAQSFNEYLQLAEYVFNIDDLEWHNLLLIKTEKLAVSLDDFIRMAKIVNNSNEKLRYKYLINAEKQVVTFEDYLTLIEQIPNDYKDWKIKLIKKSAIIAKTSLDYSKCANAVYYCDMKLSRRLFAEAENLANSFKDYMNIVEAINSSENHLKIEISRKAEVLAKTSTDYLILSQSIKYTDKKWETKLIEKAESLGVSSKDFALLVDVVDHDDTMWQRQLAKKAESSAISSLDFSMVAKVVYDIIQDFGWGDKILDNAKKTAKKYEDFYAAKKAYRSKDWMFGA